MRWLIPRLGRYHVDHLHVEVVVTTVSCVQEELRGGVDLSIRRGVARADIWPQHRNDMDTLIMSPALRSEEHTSELQSLLRISYAVFCLQKKIHLQKHTQYR